MKRYYVLFTVVFFLMLLLPLSWELAHSVCEKKAFAPFDLFRDAVRPVVRESVLQREADSLYAVWREALSVAESSDVSLEKREEAFSLVDECAQNLKRTIMNVNAYLPLDSLDSAVQNISAMQKLLAAWESEEDVRDSLEHLALAIREEYSSFSWKRLGNAWLYHGFLNGDYLRAYENQQEKENAFVKKTRPVYQAFAWKVLQDPGEKAVVADSNFLFYRQDVDFLVKPAPWTTDSLDNPIEAVLDFKKELEKKGIELLVVVVPGKPTIYPEILNPQLYGLSGMNISLGRRFVDTLRSLNVNVVNLYTPLMQAKQKDRRKDFLYLNTDTHWTPRGAQIAAKVIADDVKKLPVAKNLPHEDWVDSLVMADRVGDVATMANLEYAFPQQRVEAFQVKNAKTGTPRGNDFRKAKILILGDSYSRIYETDAPMSSGWISHLAKELRTPVASIVSDGGSSTLVREKLARRSGVLKGKTLVIWEFVERDLRFGAEGWKKVRLD